MAYPPITSLGAVPQRTQTPAEFATNADSFLGALPNFRTELNTFGAYIDSSGAEIEADKAAAQASAAASANSASASESSAALALSYKDLALGAANFKGNWSALTGALNVPASVYHNGLTWVLLTNLANVAASEPSAGSTWAVASGESFTRYVDSLFSRAVLDFNFARNKYFAYEQFGLEPKQLTSVLQTLRASTETYTSPFNVQSVGADTPSIQYNATNGEPLGINVRPASTNLLLHSQYTAASGETPPTGWTAAFTTGTTTTAASTRFANAVRLTATGTNQREFISQTVTLAATTTYTLSCYFADGTSANGVMLQASSSGGDTPTGTTDFSSAAALTAGVYSVTFTTGATGGTYSIRVGLGCNANATGTVIHETPQLEVGSFYTGYIPTTTAQVTRAATQVRRDMGSNFNLAGGVLYVEFIAQDFGNLERLIAIGDTNTTDETSISYGGGATSNKITAVIRAGATNTTLSSSATFVAGQLCKAALRYTRNSSGTYGWTFFINGVTGSSVTSATLPPNYEKLAIGCRHYNSATLQPYTPIKRAVYLGGVFSGADVQVLTA